MQAVILWSPLLNPLDEMLITQLGNFLNQLQICSFFLPINEHVLLVIMPYVFYVLGRLLSIAEETLAEFLSKATGTAVDWVQMPGMKVLISSFNLINFTAIIVTFYFLI